MLTALLLLLGGVLIALALVDTPVSRLPMSPALLYLLVGWVAAALLDAPPPRRLLEHNASGLAIASEFFLLISLFAVGLRLRVPPTWAAWRVALLLAGPGMILTIVLAAAAAVLLLGLPWPMAFLLACVLAPTDPVLASEVQMRSNEDRDAVRLSITAEGGLNDGTAFPAVMLALGLLKLHELGGGGLRWLWADLLWPIVGGALVGGALGVLLGRFLCWLLVRGDHLARDELVYVGTVALAYGLARALDVSAFLAVFVAGVALLLPLRHDATVEGEGHALAERMLEFGGRCERLVEAAAVLGLGVALHGVGPSGAQIGFAIVLMVLVRPLAVLGSVRRRAMPTRQRRLVAWFGIRGIGSLFYLLFVLEHGLRGEPAMALIATTLTCIAVSIVLHGISATPLMSAYQRRREHAAPPKTPDPPPP